MAARRACFVFSFLIFFFCLKSQRCSGDMVTPCRWDHRSSIVNRHNKRDIWIERRRNLCYFFAVCYLCLCAAIEWCSHIGWFSSKRLCRLWLHWKPYVDKDMYVVFVASSMYLIVQVCSKGTTLSISRWLKCDIVMYFFFSPRVLLIQFHFVCTTPVLYIAEGDLALVDPTT